jgi:predicted aconitase
MTNKKISELNAASTLAGTEVLPVVQSSATVKATVNQVLANLSASNLTSGTVPLARLSGITASQIANDTITATQIANATITDTQVSASAAIAWSKISKTGSSLADLATRTTANLTDFPSQSGQSGKYLTTDGTVLSWGTVASGSSRGLFFNVWR